MEIKLKEQVNVNSLTFKKRVIEEAIELLGRKRNYIDNDILPNNLPIEIESTIIRLLQNDLNTNESDMNILLESAKQKASLDALVHRME